MQSGWENREKNRAANITNNNSSRKGKELEK